VPSPPPTAGPVRSRSPDGPRSQGGAGATASKGYRDLTLSAMSGTGLQRVGDGHVGVVEAMPRGVAGGAERGVAEVILNLLHKAPLGDQ